MTSKEILEKAIVKAIKNGYTINPGIDPSIIRCRVSDTRIRWFIFNSRIEQEIPYTEASIYGVIFSLNFAKAFWGDSNSAGTTHDNSPTGKPIELGSQNDSGVPMWQYHLQQMVLIEDPPKYLESFLPKDDKQ